MTRAGRVCIDCPDLAEPGQNRCTDCRLERQRRADAKRPNARQRGYDGQWERVARRYRAAHPTCECPGYGCPHDQGECGAMSYPIDHITPRRHFSSATAANQDTNLQALCVPCHGRKTALLDGAFGREPGVPDSGVGGVPGVGRHP